MSPEPAPAEAAPKAAAPPSVTVVERRPNPLLDREEVTFRLDFAGPMVARADALLALSGSLQVPPERVALRRLRVAYGKPGATGLARVYATPEALKRVEAPHILRRLSGEKREKAAPAEKREAPKKEEAKAEKKEEPKKEEKKPEAKPEGKKEGPKKEEKPAGSAGAAPPQARAEKKETPKAEKK